MAPRPVQSKCHDVRPTVYLSVCPSNKYADWRLLIKEHIPKFEKKDPL